MVVKLHTYLFSNSDCLHTLHFRLTVYSRIYTLPQFISLFWCQDLWFQTALNCDCDFCCRFWFDFELFSTVPSICICIVQHISSLQLFTLSPHPSPSSALQMCIITAPTWQLSTPPPPLDSWNLPHHKLPKMVKTFPQKQFQFWEKLNFTISTVQSNRASVTLHVRSACMMLRRLSLLSPPTHPIPSSDLGLG